MVNKLTDLVLRCFISSCQFICQTIKSGLFTADYNCINITWSRYIHLLLLIHSLNPVTFLDATEAISQIASNVIQFAGYKLYLP